MTQPLKKTLEDIAFELRGNQACFVKHVAFSLQK
jgi:hypothetical protein